MDELSVNLKYQACGGGRCPRVFTTEEGHLVVQGIQADNDTITKLEPLDNEQVVILPKDVAIELVAWLKNNSI